LTGQARQTSEGRGFYRSWTIKENHPLPVDVRPCRSVDTPDPYTAIHRLSKPHPALFAALSPRWHDYPETISSADGQV